MPYAEELNQSVLAEDEELNSLVEESLKLLDREDGVFVRVDFETVDLRNKTERKLRHIFRTIGQSKSFKVSSPPATPRIEVRRKEAANGFKKITLLKEDTTTC